ncbi:MAG: Fe-S cluster assembly protein SufD [Propionibacteriales bacterium]|nr:Fe-S cluster assembly protein SufD [Propionibacteriales bacterium]
MVSNVQEAVEAAASHLHPPGSFEPDEHPVPTGREEVWRFTPLKRLQNLHKDIPLDGQDYTVDVQAAPEITAESVAADHPAKGSSGYVPTDRVSARAWQAADKVFLVTIPKETVAAEPTVITLRGSGTKTAAAGHLVVQAGPFSESTVVLLHEGSATFADNIEVVLAEGARLTLVSVQDWDDDAVHHTHHHAVVGRDASLKHAAVSFGGDLVRMNASVAYDGPGGEVEMLGLYFADAGQHLEHRLFVDHNAPHTRSDVLYKGALQGKGAHTVWIGNVMIRKAAEGIETFETNRNLVLTDGCQADSVPNLEIETGEIVGAGHASATGRFDDEQLFYLQSRGVPEDEARRLVVHGFFADIVRRVGVPEIERRLLESVEDELAKNVGLPPATPVGAAG